MVHDWQMTWTQVAAIATAVAAAVTAYMAYQTRNVARATQRAAGASLDEAKATRELAEQAKEDRVLAHHPWLSAERVGSDISCGPQVGDEQVKIVNIGTGAALGCIFAMQGGGYRFITSMVDLGPNDARAVPAHDAGNSPPDEWFGVPPLADAAIFCHDVFGRRYRFLVRDGYVQTPEIRDAQDCQGPSNSQIWWLHVSLWGPRPWPNLLDTEA
jgi:hypothetical protein